MTETKPTRREFVDVDPNALQLDANVRTLVDVDPDFYLSIKEHGVRTPVQAWRGDDGQLYVEEGQRRLLAARQAGLETITVEVIDRPGADAREIERGRIIRQLAENDHRAALTEAEHVAASAALFDLDMKPDEIAKATHRPRKVVREEVKLARDAGRTVQVMSEHLITLEQAAQLAEFEDDEALHQTLAERAAADPTQFAVDVRKLQQEREQHRQRAAVVAEIEARGDRVVEGPDTSYEPLSYLKHPDVVASVKNQAQITVDQARELGGLGFRVKYVERWNGTSYERLYDEHPVIENPSEHGYLPRYSRTSAGELSDEEKQRRREKRARRKEWAAISELRVEWIRDELLQRRKLPDDAIVWVARVLAGDRESYPSEYNPHMAPDRELAMTWLGLHARSSYDSPNALAAAATGKGGRDALRVALAVALARMEAYLTNPKSVIYAEAQHHGEYFAQLAEWGYQLTELEYPWTKAAQKKRSKQ